MSLACRRTPSLLDLLPQHATVGTSSSPLCSTPSASPWGLIFDQTTLLHPAMLLRGLPQAAKWSVYPIPQIVACNVWGVGPIALTCSGIFPLQVGGMLSVSSGPTVSVSGGGTIPLWGGGFDGESTPLA